MAEIKQGILGPVNGKVGTVVGITWRGRHFLRAKPLKSHKPASEAQLLQRARMKLVSPFTSKIKNFVNRQYPLKKIGERIINGQEQLNSYLLKEGIEVIEGSPCLIIEKVLLSIGVLPPAAIKKVSFLKDFSVKVQWDDSIINALTLPSDQLTMVVYNDETDSFHISENIAKREEKYTHFMLEKNWMKGNIHFWSVWTAADQSMHSTSIYHSPLTLDKTSPKQDNKTEQEAAE